MLLMKKIIILIALFSQNIFAGSKGLDVLIFNIGDKNFYESPAYESFIDASSHDKCWESIYFGEVSSGIAFLTQKKMPSGMNTDLAMKVWNGDSRAIKMAQKIMRENIGGAGDGEGYHGMYIVNPNGEKLSILGVGAHSNQKTGLSGVSKKISDIKINNNNPGEFVKAFEKGLCKVTKSFSVGTY
jgi:hypothetical protein